MRETDYEFISRIKRMLSGTVNYNVRKCDVRRLLEMVRDERHDAFFQEHGKNDRTIAFAEDFDKTWEKVNKEANHA